MSEDFYYQFEPAIVYFTNGKKCYADSIYSVQEEGFLCIEQNVWIDNQETKDKALLAVSLQSILFISEVDEWPSWYSPPRHKLAIPDLTEENYFNLTPSSGIHVDPSRDVPE